MTGNINPGHRGKEAGERDEDGREIVGRTNLADR
jgi:hypothetical protein